MPKPKRWAMIVALAMTVTYSTMHLDVAAQESILPVPGESLKLWRDLHFGDTPDAVQQKLQKMPEVERVKNVMKKGIFADQDINMKEGGVLIFDGHFSVTTAYRDGGLAAVQLTSGIGCVDQGHPLSKKIEVELQNKYPDVANNLVDATTYELRALDATPQQPTSVNSVYRDENVAVFLRTHFFKTDPPAYFGGSNLNRSLYNLQRTLYEQGANACGGTGYRRAQISISYIRRTDYNRLVDQITDEHAEDRKKAADNL